MVVHALRATKDDTAEQCPAVELAEAHSAKGVQDVLEAVRAEAVEFYCFAVPSFFAWNLAEFFNGFTKRSKIHAEQNTLIFPCSLCRTSILFRLYDPPEDLTI